VAGIQLIRSLFGNFANSNGYKFQNGLPFQWLKIPERVTIPMIKNSRTGHQVASRSQLQKKKMVIDGVTNSELG